MKGSNKIVVNSSTIMAMAQHYFDTVLFVKDASPKVVSVAPTTDNMFTISVTEKNGKPDA